MKKLRAKNKSKRDFNRDSHPERHVDEVFLTNSSIDPDEGEDGTPPWQKIKRETVRIGKVAYDPEGKPLGGFNVPVFVKQHEIWASENGEKILARLLPRT